MELRTQLHALERALTQLGVRVLEEELPEEAHVDGGLCRIDGVLVLYVAPSAPPWRRATVFLDALRRLPHRDIWLPPEIRSMLESEDSVDNPNRLISLRGKERL